MTPLELDEIRQRVAAHYEGSWPYQPMTDARDLLAEVERLRANQADQRRIIEAQDAALAKAEHDHCGCLGTASYHRHTAETNDG